MTLDLIPSRIISKGITEGGAEFMTIPSEGEGRRSSERIYTRDDSLGEGTRTSLKTVGSTREAGDPRSKMKSTRGSLDFFFIRLSTPDCGMSDNLPRKTWD